MAIRERLTVPLLASVLSSELQDFLEQSFTTHTPLLTATSTFGLGRQC